MNKKDYFTKKILDNNGIKEDIYIYNEKAFIKLQEAGLLAYKTLEYITQFVEEGITTEELDKKIHEFIILHNAIPATLGYNGYPKSSCISLNHEVCHGIPNEKKLASGDILNIDVTVILDGWYGDTSRMFSVGKTSIKAKNLIAVTEQCLEEAIKIAKPNTTLGDLGAVISEIAHKNRFSVVEEFCGHGIGHEFHQNPSILHFGNYGKGLKLEPGMVFTIEPMINAGGKSTKMLNNQWTAITKDFSLSAQFEHTIGITENGNIIFTKPQKNNAF